MKTLHLNLHKKWFDMIRSGEKKEEYREIKPYWASRLLLVNFKKQSILWWGDYAYKRQLLKQDFALEIVLGINRLGVQRVPFESITFSNGFAKDSPRFEIRINKMSIKKGRADWGADPNKNYFVFELGEILA